MKKRLRVKKGKQYVAAYFNSKDPKINRPGWKGKWSICGKEVKWCGGAESYTKPRRRCLRSRGRAK